jgi:gluconokinase
MKSPERTDMETSSAELEAAKHVGKTVLLLMGVAGSGKTTIALELQRVLNWPYIDGDDLHPAANVAKMRAGHPLNDEDRWPWLRATAGEPGIITCSDLKRAYRDVTIGERKGVMLIYLRGEEGLIADRIAQRTHRYMPPSLLTSQFETLEEPTADEHPVVVPVQGAVAETVTNLLQNVAAAQQKMRG